MRKAGDLVSPQSEKLYRIELESAFASQDALRSFIYDFEDEFPTEDLGTLWEQNPDNGGVVQEIKKKLIDRLIISRREAGQAGYNEKQAKKTTKNKGFGTPTKVEGQDGFYLQMPNGDLEKVSEAVYNRRKDYINREILNLPDA